MNTTTESIMYPTASEPDAVLVPEPNYTDIPNVILGLMPCYQGAELPVVLYICYRTFGWNQDRLVSAQEIIDFFSGQITWEQLWAALESLEKRKLICREGVGLLYTLIVNA